MTEPPIHVAVLIVACNGREYLAECLQSVLASHDAPLTRHIVVFDNASSDGTVEFLQQEFPQVHCVESRENLGFAGGNNEGWKYIVEKLPEVRYLCLLNQDTVVEDGWLVPLVQHLERTERVACVQAKLRLWPAKDKINTLGNRSHFLGFGFTSHGGELDQGQGDTVRSIDYPSGAAFMVRADLVRKLGLFDPVYFLYLEDAELGWKLRQAGYDVQFQPNSVVYHKYEFKADFRNYYYLERNRWWLLLTYYKLRTLLLLLPALGLMEIGQLGFALRHGCLVKKLRSYGFFLSIRNLRALMQRRREAQARRTISDRRFLRHFIGRIDVPELDTPVIRYVANPLLNVSWTVARMLIWW
jgi:GT2 family glycosyltransferase